MKEMEERRKVEVQSRQSEREEDVAVEMRRCDTPVDKLSYAMWNSLVPDQEPTCVRRHKYLQQSVQREDQEAIFDEECLDRDPFMDMARRGTRPDLRCSRFCRRCAASRWSEQGPDPAPAAAAPATAATLSIRLCAHAGPRHKPRHNPVAGGILHHPSGAGRKAETRPHRSTTPVPEKAPLGETTSRKPLLGLQLPRATTPCADHTYDSGVGPGQRGLTGTLLWRVSGQANNLKKNADSEYWEHYSRYTKMKKDVAAYNKAHGRSGYVN